MPSSMLKIVLIGLLAALPTWASDEEESSPAELSSPPTSSIIPKFPSIAPKKPVFAALPPGPTFNVMAGVNLFYPSLGFQYSMGEMGTVGALVHSYRVSIQGHKSRLLGGLVTFGGYSENAFEGIWFQLGGGVYSATSEYNGSSGKGIAYGGLGSLGYRFRFDGWNIGFAGGAMFFDIAKTGSVPRASVLWPTGLVDVGFAF